MQTDDPTGVSDYLDAVDKYVVSATLDDPGWEHSTVLRGDLVEEVRALKGADGRDIVATGSVRLVHALIADDLVDEYRLFVFPVVVGGGARLFGSAIGPLRLLERDRSSPAPSCCATLALKAQDEHSPE